MSINMYDKQYDNLHFLCMASIEREIKILESERFAKVRAQEIL